MPKRPTGDEEQHNPRPLGKFWDCTNSDTPVATPDKEAHATPYMTGLAVMYGTLAQQCNFMNATPLQPCQLKNPGRYLIEDQENTTRKELIRAEVNDANGLFSLLLSYVQSTKFLNDHRQKHQGHIHQNEELLLQNISELEAVATNDILSHHKSRNPKIFGPDQTSPDRIVLAFVIKQNSYNKAFQLLWRQISQCNGGFIDPFHHTEKTMTNFVLVQGLLRGPITTHHPVKLPPNSWFSIVEQEAAEHALENQMGNVLLSAGQQPSSTEELTYTTPTVICPHCMTYAYITHAFLNLCPKTSSSCNSLRSAHSSQAQNQRYTSCPTCCVSSNISLNVANKNGTCCDTLINGLHYHASSGFRMQQVDENPDRIRISSLWVSHDSNTVAGHTRDGLD